MINWCFFLGENKIVSRGSIICSDGRRESFCGVTAACSDYRPHYNVAIIL